MATQAFVIAKTKIVRKATSAIRALTAGLRYECKAEASGTCYPTNNALWLEAWEALDELQTAIEQAKKFCP